MTKLCPDCLEFECECKPYEPPKQDGDVERVYVGPGESPFPWPAPDEEEEERGVCMSCGGDMDLDPNHPWCDECA